MHNRQVAQLGRDPGCCTIRTMRWALHFFPDPILDPWRARLTPSPQQHQASAGAAHPHGSPGSRDPLPGPLPGRPPAPLLLAANAPKGQDAPWTHAPPPDWEPALDRQKQPAQFSHQGKPPPPPPPAPHPALPFRLLLPAFPTTSSSGPCWLWTASIEGQLAGGAQDPKA